ncbi:MAG: transferase, partial [Clostridiales bacterium]|nr:transferase [Clostridiales bacterium]
MKIAIYGAGGFGKEVACLIKRINDNGGDWELIGFFDDT